MEVSSELKDDIRKTQNELKNAIRVHQMWVARLHEDENNINLKSKVREAEKDIISIGQNQKRVVDRLRRELELYQHRLKARNKQVNVEIDARYIAQQLREHQMQYRTKNRPISLLKPSVLNEIHIKTENTNGSARPNDISDSENEGKSMHEKENSNHSEIEDKERYPKSYHQNAVHDSRNNFAHALNKVKESFIGVKLQENEWQTRLGTDSDSTPPDNNDDMSPSPSPPPLPRQGEHVSQEVFLRFIGLVTPQQKEILEKKRNERRKRSTTSTNKNDFLYGNLENSGKRKKYNQFPYLQSHSDPPQTRSAKLRKQQKQSENSREGSPSGSSTEARGWPNKPAWAASLPPGLSVEPVFSPGKKACHGCGRNDVPSLLVRCSCGVYLHTGCGADGHCTNCQASLPDPSHCAASPQHDAQLFRADRFPDKLAERKRLQEKNIQLCVELRKLEARAATLKENLDDHHMEKRQLLSDQIKTQRNLQKLLDFISQFKETSVSIQSTSISDTGSEISKSNED
ncbi:uncharacterized protein LOC105388991 isoform X1 [Plutella xylostella]|uniref:uncharacterized protein LOC105388991 isoform X1 n=1 Tax=Plutella xylostella TaxID=51655 RepID=UPI0020330517|nr:uncharacterized protein LOC105388991 isoform X1 [Plutella xylostella]XP_037968070.2 uncharacterized protein LOC105388991 isoform X1 [Plutella xylostella]XP_037968072.2 uncharacterized protein LOC105388991 isoform X1 [Plutella xylostella]